MPGLQASVVPVCLAKCTQVWPPVATLVSQLPVLSHGARGRPRCRHLAPLSWQGPQWRTVGSTGRTWAPPAERPCSLSPSTFWHIPHILVLAEGTGGARSPPLLWCLVHMCGPAVVSGCRQQLPVSLHPPSIPLGLWSHCPNPSVGRTPTPSGPRAVAGVRTSCVCPTTHAAVDTALRTASPRPCAPLALTRAGGGPARARANC